MVNSIPGFLGLSCFFNCGIIELCRSGGMADATDLKSVAFNGRVGSTPIFDIIIMGSLL